MRLFTQPSRSGKLVMFIADVNGVQLSIVVKDSKRILPKRDPDSLAATISSRACEASC